MCVCVCISGNVKHESNTKQLLPLDHSRLHWRWCSVEHSAVSMCDSHQPVLAGFTQKASRSFHNINALALSINVSGGRCEQCSKMSKPDQQSNQKHVQVSAEESSKMQQCGGGAQRSRREQLDAAQTETKRPDKDQVLPTGRPVHLLSLQEAHSECVNLFLEMFSFTRSSMTQGSVCVSAGTSLELNQDVS